jgi:phosphatidate phosphatase PAH1
MSSSAAAIDVVCVRGFSVICSQFYVKFNTVTATTVNREVIFFRETSLCPAVVANVGADQVMYFVCNGESVSNIPSASTILGFCLKRGENCMRCGNEEIGFASFSIWFWEISDKIIVVDIDGTITKSNVRGYFETVFRGTYDHIHDGVVGFLLMLENMGANVLYLTARPLSHIEETRLLLKNVREDGISLPAGPLFTNRGGAMTSLYMELIAQATSSFKFSVLRDVCNVFKMAHEKRPNITSVNADTEGKTSGVAEPIESGEILSHSALSDQYSNPIIMGIGNKETDSLAYYCAGVPSKHIFLLEKSGEITVGGFKPTREVEMIHNENSRDKPLIVDDSAKGIYDDIILVFFKKCLFKLTQADMFIIFCRIETPIFMFMLNR